MSDQYDSRNLHQEPFTINNQLFVLGNPVVNAQTLEQLVHALDQLGLNQPIVIINPEATTVPNFEDMLSNLIQNNRSRQFVNVTTDDKYRFMNMSDEELNRLVDDLLLKNPVLDREVMLDMYMGIRARAQALYSLEHLCHERDELWNLHCANPSSTEGSERYAELVGTLIPQAQSYYDWVCNKLKELDELPKIKEGVELPVVQSEKTIEEPEKITDAAVSSETTDTVCTASENAIDAQPVFEDTGLTDIVIDDAEHHRIWGPWNSIMHMQMPLSSAKELVSKPGYAGLVAQQRDVEFDGKRYQAVEPEFLIALGIEVYPDGLPIVYTELGTFKRVGYNHNQPLNNLQYWYPKPKF